MGVYHLPRMPKGSPEFCRTPTATAIDQVIELTYRRGGIALIVTAPGAGKTTVMRAWEAGCEHFDVRYCVATPAKVYSLPAFMTLLIEAVDAPDVFGVHTKHKQICRYIEDEDLRLLLVDEAQHLNDGHLDELRSIHDETGIGLVLAGNARLRSRFNSEKSARFAQLTSRISARVDRENTTAEGCRGAGRLQRRHLDPKAVAWLKKRCVGVGGLRHADAPDQPREGYGRQGRGPARPDRGSGHHPSGDCEMSGRSNAADSESREKLGDGAP